MMQCSKYRAQVTHRTQWDHRGGARPPEGRAEDGSPLKQNREGNKGACRGVGGVLLPPCLGVRENSCMGCSSGGEMGELN